MGTDFKKEKSQHIEKKKRTGRSQVDGKMEALKSLKNTEGSTCQAGEKPKSSLLFSSGTVQVE